MSYITVVIEYQKNDFEPAFYAGMKVLGGKVIAVQFDDTLAENERYHEALTEIASGNGVYGQQAGEYKEIARKALGSEK